MNDRLPARDGARTRAVDAPAPADPRPRQGAGSPRIAILADDLIWATRLEAFVRGAGAQPSLSRDVEHFEHALADGNRVSGVVIDATSRAYDGVAAVRLAVAAGLPALVAAQHDAVELRRRALQAGASRVLPYARLHTDGPALVRAWLDDLRGEPDAETREAGAASSTLARGPIEAGRFAERLSATQSRLLGMEAAALLVSVGADLRWLTGYAAMPLERLTLLVLPALGEASLIVPRLEAAPARLAPAVAAGDVRLLTWEETEDPVALIPDLVGMLPFTAADNRAGKNASAVGRLLVSDRLPAMFLLRLQTVLPGARYGLASEALRDLRMIKDADEIDRLRAAARAADRVIAAIARGPLVGRSEDQVAREVRDRLVDEGHEVASFSIVGSGPNSASPHHAASTRVIQPGEPIVLDIGGTLGGYGSDVTRTLWVTGGDPSRGPDAEFSALYEVLRRAQAAGVAAVGPGVPCEQIDRVAREVITAGGYGAQFIHRTGHGIGLEEHEDPYLVAGNALPLRPGYAFSVEPGIYLEGRYGARIEDIVVCGPDGPDPLNRAPHGLLVVDG